MDDENDVTGFQREKHNREGRGGGGGGGGGGGHKSTYTSLIQWNLCT